MQDFEHRRINAEEWTKHNLPNTVHSFNDSVKTGSVETIRAGQSALQHEYATGIVHGAKAADAIVGAGPGMAKGAAFDAAEHYARHLDKEVLPKLQIHGH